MFIITVIPLTKLPLDKPQTYTYFTSYELSRGSLVLAPLYRRQVTALVIDITPLKNLSKIDIRKASFELKQVTQVLCETPLLTAGQLKLIAWMNHYYYAPLGLIVKTVIPEKLINKKFLSSRKEEENKPNEQSTQQKPLLIHSSLSTRIKIYIKEINQAINRNRQTLILVPQVYQINELERAVKSSLNNLAITCVSSNNKITEFRSSWQDIKEQKADIIIGTRSAMFTPFKNLGLIILDEEENSGHISWDMTPKYDGRKVAEKLAEFHGCKLVFGSDTPSVEYYHKIQNSGKIISEHFVEEKHKWEIIDMRDEIHRGNYSILSEALKEQIERMIAKQKQVVLFVNRRGTFRFVMCRDCGFTIKCPNCEIPLILHELESEEAPSTIYGKRTPFLECHHCNYRSNPPTRCPDCNGLRIKGFGIGTQRVEQEIKKIFSKSQVTRIDSDTMKNLIRRASSLNFLNNQVEPKGQIIIGTQMIFSYPSLKKVGLIGIITIDSMLNLPDFRMNERVFQTLCKLSTLGSKVLIQTYNPDNHIFTLLPARDYTRFFKQEIEERQIFSYPPFSSLVKIVYRDKSSEIAQRNISNLNSRFQNYVDRHKLEEKIDILGPSPAFISKEKGQWVWQIILKLKGLDEKTRRGLLQLVPLGWEIEVDPESLI